MREGNPFSLQQEEKVVSDGTEFGYLLARSWRSSDLRPSIVCVKVEARDLRTEVHQFETNTDIWNSCRGEWKKVLTKKATCWECWGPSWGSWPWIYSGTNLWNLCSPPAAFHVPGTGTAKGCNWNHIGLEFARWIQSMLANECLRWQTMESKLRREERK